MPERHYRVSAGSEVLGHAPGTTFSTDLDSEHEERLLASGALETAGSSAEPSGVTGEHVSDDAKGDPDDDEGAAGEAAAPATTPPTPTWRI